MKNIAEDRGMEDGGDDLLFKIEDRKGDGAKLEYLLFYFAT